jgi:hypothetical protein
MHAIHSPNFIIKMCEYFFQLYYKNVWILFSNLIDKQTAKFLFPSVGRKSLICASPTLQE